jgi:hypothetical protein
MSSSASLVYLFGIVRAHAPPGRSAGVTTMGGAEFGPCRLLPQGSLSAVVSDLSLPEGETLDHFLRDPCRAEKTILHHHRMLEGMVSQSTVVPLRFGSVFSDDEGVRAVLAKGHDAFVEEINGIDGAAEWGLKVFCDRGRLGEKLSCERPQIAELKLRLSSASEGKAFFLERRLERLVHEESDRAIIRCLDDTKQRLKRLSRRFALGKIQHGLVHGHDSEMVFNGAFLISRGSEEGFFAVVDDLCGAFSGFGFDYESTGPWPPYSFVHCNLDGGGNAV